MKEELVEPSGETLPLETVPANKKNSAKKEYLAEMSKTITPRSIAVKELLDGKMGDLIRKNIKPSMNKDRTMASIARALYATPRLAECDGISFATSLMEAFSLGLEINTVLGHAYLIPYGKTCRLIVGYRGLVKLVMDSGKVAYIDAHVVHEKDNFTLEYSDNMITHYPWIGEDRGIVKGAWAKAKLTNGDVLVRFLARDEIEAIRKRSKASDDGPWVTDYNEMAKKTVIRNLCKMLPMCEQAQAVALNDEIKDYGIGVEK